MSSTTILLLIIIAILGGGTIGDILGGIGIMMIVGIVFFILGWLGIVLFVINPTLLLIIVGGLIILGLVLYVPKLIVKLSKNAVDKRLNTVKNNQKINKNDLKILIDNYEKSIKKITNNPQQNTYALEDCARKFAENFNLWRRLYDLMNELHSKYIYYHQENHSSYGVWQSHVIPISAISAENGKEVQLKHKNVTVNLHPSQKVYDASRRELEVLENDIKEYRVRIETTDHYDYNNRNPYYSGDSSTTSYADIFKPGNWLMEIYNLCVDYNNEKVQMAHNDLLLKKGNFSSSS